MSKQLTTALSCALTMLLLFSVSASAMYTTFQAKIIKPDGTPLESTSVNFRFTILDPLGSCILYTENFNTINMSGSGGLVYFSLGSGIKTFPASGSVSFSDVFNNQNGALSCEVGGPPSYTPVANDLRKIVMQFHDGSGWQTLPAMAINHVPYSMYAKNAASATTAVNSAQLNGKTDLDFVQVTSIPTCSASQALQFNGASFSCVAVGSSGSGAVVSVSGSAPIVISGSASAPVISMSVASMTSDGYLTAADYAEFKAVSATANNALVKSNNLSDLTNSAMARANLGLGSLATANSIDLGSASATGVISDTRLSNQSGVTSGAQYTKVTVDGKGRVTSGAQLSASDVTAALGYTPQASGTISSQWTDAGSAIYYSGGNVGIGTATPVHSLDIEKSGTGSYTGAKTTVTSTSGNATGFDTIVNGSNYSTGVLVDTQSTLASVGIDVYASVTTSGGSWVRGVNVGIDDSLVAGTGLRLFAGSASTTPSKAVHISSGYNAGYAIYADTNGKSYFKGNVGIGTSTPATKLDVSGGVRIGAENASCSAGLAGTLRYASGTVEYCDGAIWSSMVSTSGFTSAAIVTSLGYTPADVASVTTLSSTVSSLSSSVATSLTSVTNSLTSVSNSVTTLSGQVGSIQSSQWVNASGVSSTSVAAATYSPLGQLGTQYSVPTSGGVDDGYYMFTLPFAVNFNGTSYSSIYVGTNSYVTFGGGSTQYSALSATNPSLNKIVVDADDRSSNSVWFYSDATSFSIRYEGGCTTTPGTALVWELQGSTADVNQLKLQIISVCSGGVSMVADTAIALQYVTATAGTAYTVNYGMSGSSNIYYTSGNVGIGVTMPLTKLALSGGVQLGMESASCAVGYAGTLRYNSGNIEFCNGTTWSGFTVSGTISSQWSTSGTTINYMAGNVGIGTTNPSATLSVSGSLLVTDRIKIQGTAGLPAPQMP